MIYAHPTFAIYQNIGGRESAVLCCVLPQKRQKGGNKGGKEGNPRVLPFRSMSKTALRKGERRKRKPRAIGHGKKEEGNAP